MALLFLFLIKTICCDPSSEPSHRDGSDEWSQHTFFCRINKNYPSLSLNTPSYLELCDYVTACYLMTALVLNNPGPILNRAIWHVVFLCQKVNASLEGSCLLPPIEGLQS